MLLLSFTCKDISIVMVTAMSASKSVLFNREVMWALLLLQFNSKK